MLGIFVMILFMAFGVMQATAVFHERSMMIKVWLGMTMGLMEMMWFPSVFAYAFDFTMTAQIFALSLSALISACACVFAARKTKTLAKSAGREGEMDAGFLLLVIFPAVILTAFLQYTHTFVNVNGDLHVGQSTYGDLCMHAGFATGLIGQSYPPEYTLLPGTLLGYPFLADALSSTMLLFGTPLAQALYVPGTVMCAIFYMGFVIFAYHLTGKKSAAALAFYLFFFSGGLGFTRLFDENGLNEFVVSDTLFGYYRAPTNLPEENLRWVNALSDLLIPQRTLMAGWMCLMPCFYLLTAGMRERKMKDFVCLGVWAGALPMIHTHSFLALGAVSLGALVYTMAFQKERKKSLFLFGAYGVLACLLSAYQLFTWTFPQTMDGGSLRIQFNWVNNNGTGGLMDNYFWFWIRNVGIMYAVFPLAAIFTKNRSARALALGALILYAISELVLFQPNEYDNIKLFYVCYLVMLPVGADFLVSAFAWLGKKEKYNWLSAFKRVFAAVCAWAFLFVSGFSGMVTIARECLSDEVIFSSAHREAGKFIFENTPSDSVFLTKDNHNNAPNVLGGRKIVCGTTLYLHFHGVDYREAQRDMNAMLTNPEGNQHLFEKYGVDYVYLSSYERSAGADVEAFERLYPVVFESASDWYEKVQIFAINNP
ncbi:MAG: hypothetical protein IIW08_00065 [Clostridia bacterium]|nr:hypothetical protein [Clostridia bacterium]